MQDFLRWARRAALIAASTVFLGMTQQAAATTVAPLSVFQFNANCTDCATAAGSGSFAVSGTLSLIDYALGDAITINNFHSFVYNGSNLVDSYTVGEGDGSTVNNYLASTVYQIAGSIGPGVGPKRFEIEFVDGLFFQSQTTGSWSTCAPKGGVFYGGGQCFTFPVTPTDFGSSSSYSGAALVPEPESWAMMGLGLAIVLGWQRRRAGTSR